MRYVYTNNNVEVNPMTLNEYNKIMDNELVDGDDIPGYRIQHIDVDGDPTMIDYWEEKDWFEKKSLLHFFEKLNCHPESEYFEALKTEVDK